jgi:hypothetical protein
MSIHPYPSIPTNTHPQPSMPIHAHPHPPTPNLEVKTDNREKQKGGIKCEIAYRNKNKIFSTPAILLRGFEGGLRSRG